MDGNISSVFFDDYELLHAASGKRERRDDVDFVTYRKETWKLIDNAAQPAVASEPAEKWGGVVRRAKGRGLGRGYAPLQLGVC